MFNWKSILLSTFCLMGSPAVFGFDQNHGAWTEEIQKYQDKAGNIRYKNWKNNQEELNTYLSDLSKISFDTFKSWNVTDQKAFLINAYNAFTIKLILDNYPVKSIKDIGGFLSSPWKKEFFSILDGKIKSLDPIEHEWLRKMPEYKDPRVHAAVNCASVSCPRLRHEAFVGEKLDTQLTDSTKVWLDDPSRNSFQPNENQAKISKIFDWFEEDFGGNKQGVAQFIKKYGPESAKKTFGSNNYDIEYLDYNWSLNEVDASSIGH